VVKCGSDDFLSYHVSAMNSESADVLELKMGRIGKFLIFKMAEDEIRSYAHFRNINRENLQIYSSVKEK